MYLYHWGVAYTFAKYAHHRTVGDAIIKIQWFNVHFIVWFHNMEFANINLYTRIPIVKRIVHYYVYFSCLNNVLQSPGVMQECSGVYV